MNPAFEGFLGTDAVAPWHAVARELLGRSSLKLAEVMDAFGTLATPRGRSLVPVPGRELRAPAAGYELSCSAVVFHVEYTGHAIMEDLRQLKGIPPSGTALEVALRVSDPPQVPEIGRVREIDRFFTAASDPSQEAAVLGARCPSAMCSLSCGP